MRGQERLLPDGLGRQRPARPSGASRTTTTCAASRTCRYEPGLDARDGRRRGAQAAAAPGLARRTSSSCASPSPPRTRRPSRRCGSASGSRSTGRSSTRRSASTAGASRSSSFLDLFRKGHVYSVEAPTLWDVDFQHRGGAGRGRGPAAEGRLPPRRASGSRAAASFVIATTRPELLPACVAVAAHPDDERYRALFGKRAVTPLFRVPVPIFAERARGPREGHRHPDGLHVRRRDRRAVVARAGPRRCAR